MERSRQNWVVFLLGFFLIDVIWGAILIQTNLSIPGELAFLVEEMIEVNKTKPMSKQPDITGIVSIINEFGIKAGIMAWTMREKELLQLFATYLREQGVPNAVPPFHLEKGNNTTRVHTPPQTWNNFFQPSKIKGSWRDTDFDAITKDVINHFTTPSNTFKGLCKIVSAVVGAGPYGRVNLARVLYLANKW